MWVPQVAEKQDTNTRIGLALYAFTLIDVCAFALILTAAPLLEALATMGIVVGSEVLLAVMIWAMADEF
jgi:uncharacterized membrane protein (DUF485 family)